MIRASWKYLLIGVVVAVALSLAAPQANAARWWGYCGWGGCGYAPCYSCYSPCYSVGCYSGCYDGGWYLGWRPGPVRRAVFGRYKWYWGGYGCGYACGYGCGCPAYDCGCTDGTPGYAPAPGQTPTPARKPTVDQPMMPTEPPPAAPAPGIPAPATEPAAPGTMPGMPAPVPPPMPKTSATSADESGVLTVWVPYDAKVTVNGTATKSTGSRRQFVSYGLKPGLSYKYVVKAQVVRDGKTLEDTQTAVLTAGQVTAVAFGFNTAAAEQVAAAQ